MIDVFARRGRALRFCLAVLVAVLLPARPPNAADVFSWRRADGEFLLVKLCRHPLADAIIDKIPDFENLTGVKVAYAEEPESVYLRSLEECLGGSSGAPDVFMADVQHIWRFAGEGGLADLDKLIADPVLTRAGYNPDDFFSKILDLFRWGGRDGDPVGEGPLWAAPLGFGTTTLIYDRTWLSRLRLQLPTTPADLLETARRLKGDPGGDPGLLTVRDWEGANFIKSAYFPFLASFGAKWLERGEGGKGRLVARVNSPEMIAAASFWLELLRYSDRGGRLGDDYRRSADGGDRRRAALSVDANALGYRVNLSEADPASENLGFAPLPRLSGVGRPSPDLMAWGLSVNPASERREAAWFFVQYFTGQQFQSFMAVEGRGANPSRRSIVESQPFQEVIREMEGYAETLADSLERGVIPFTPARQAFSIAERWDKTLRGIESGSYPSVQAGLDDLNGWINSRLAGAGR